MAATVALAVATVTHNMALGVAASMATAVAAMASTVASMTSTVAAAVAAVKQALQEEALARG